VIDKQNNKYLIVGQGFIGKIYKKYNQIFLK